MTTDLSAIASPTEQESKKQRINIPVRRNSFQLPVTAIIQRAERQRRKSQGKIQPEEIITGAVHKSQTTSDMSTLPEVETTDTTNPNDGKLSELLGVFTQNSTPICHHA